MKHSRSGAYAAVTLFVVVTSTITALAAPPLRWGAHPPVHIRGNARTAPVDYSPAQIRTAYGVAQLGTNGSREVIAIVDAYDAPTIQNDLQSFSNYFGLPKMNVNCTVAAGPHPCFQKVYAAGVKPRSDGGWALEASLDVEWAHAIAPGADIILVEAASPSFADMLTAVDAAVAIGAHVVSMSWGGAEFASEASYDGHFSHAGVAFVASSGDNGSGVNWPAASPYVLAVGGTTLTLTGNGSVVSETAWSGSGGGISAYQTEPGYQSGYGIASGGRRAVPDVAYLASPNPGVSVYDSTPYLGQKGWFAVGGTSAGAPQWAALIALANQARSAPLSTSNPSSSPFYFVAMPPLSSTYATNYRDIVTGSDGTCTICTATPGYDYITGLGSPRANTLVPALLGY